MHEAQRGGGIAFGGGLNVGDAVGIEGDLYGRGQAGDARGVAG